MLLKFLFTKRKVVITCMLCELILFGSFIFFKGFYSLNYFIENLLLLLFYLNISYIIGKYDLLFPRNFKILIKFFNKYILILFIYSMLTIFGNILFNLNYNFQDILIRNSIFLMFSFLLQTIILFFIGNDYKNNNWITFIDPDSKKEIDNYLKIYNKNNLKRISLNSYLNCDINSEFYNGFIIDNELYSNYKKNFSNIIKINKKIPVINLLVWCNRYLEFLPVHLLNQTFINRCKERINLNWKYNYLKRIGDLLFSGLLITVTLPIMFVVALLIKIEDGGSIFYSQKRTGLNLKTFYILKFRSMRVDSEIFGAQWSPRSDPRITKIGRFLRLTRIDELPQLISVIKGEMSLIGPRPERPEINEELFKQSPMFKNRYLIKPGLSGWAQVNYNYAASIEESKNKLGYDMYYLKNISFLLDILILFKTIKIVFNLKGALSD